MFKSTESITKSSGIILVFITYFFGNFKNKNGVKLPV